MPNAVEMLTNLEEGTVLTAKTNGSGDYKFLDLKAGTYTLTIEGPGFEKWSVAGLTLAVRQELRVDATLSVGAVQQQVPVTGDTVSAIETDSPTISGTFTADDATNLPVNTRASFNGTSAANILGALPGVQDDSSGISLQGALPYQTEVTVDGVTVKERDRRQLLSAMPFLRPSQSPRFAPTACWPMPSSAIPAQIVVTTKGGTNTLHGSGFWYYQSSAFDAIPYTYPTTTTKLSHRKHFRR